MLKGTLFITGAITLTLCTSHAVFANGVSSPFNQLFQRVQSRILVAGQAVSTPGVAIRSGDLEDFVEETVEKYFGHCVDDVDVDIRNHSKCIEVEVDARDINSFLKIRSFVMTMPQLTGYKVLVFYEDLDDHLEDVIENALGPWVDDVDVDVNHRKCWIEIDIELRSPSAYPALQQLLASRPELAGYKLRLEVEYDD